MQLQHLVDDRVDFACDFRSLTHFAMVLVFLNDSSDARAQAHTRTQRTEVTIDFPELVVRVTTPVGENKVGSSARVHVRNGNGTPGRMLYGYHWDKEGMLGP